jgi:hypothetical protein
MLALVAEHARAWNINVAPLAERVAAATAQLEAACGARGRAVSEIERALQIFARPGLAPDSPALLTQFRRFHPWFGDVPDTEVCRAALCGGAGAARAQLARMRRELALDLPIVDLTGLRPAEAAEALEIFAPAPG